ncbi:hypothetical protein SAMN05216296_0873 [Pseudomonas pohangensis]|uniref:Methyltransferase domain-containing protein n=1 Tax=Pseudomonas pohangensis TaxID=364197 RepID=A0A1H2ELL9_9PSED|nr:hypothetical protein [Pseudomonas pohangensis]SDT95668.1 hypothetical protein SAMN05216296_0873 [Pseudomonas pohangensis]
MWESEAQWMARKVRQIFYGGPLSNANCLNLGSSTIEYRASKKPYIGLLMDVILKQGLDITHVDFKKGDGINISGDFCDEAFRLKLSEIKYDLILCNNVLTHVESPSCVYKIIDKCLVVGGYVIVSAPTIYPYCADPYDSKYRPSVQDVMSNLPRLQVVEWVEIESSETHLTRLKENPRQLVSFLYNIFVPIRGYRRWVNVLKDIYNINRKFKTICVLMKCSAE